MSNLKQICEQVIEAGEKATPRPWQRHKTIIHSGKENGHELNSEVLAHGPLHLLDSKQYSSLDYIVLSSNNVEKLARACLLLVEAVSFICHECMHSHENCPTREQMQVKAKQALAEVDALFEKEKNNA